jgi:2-dehydro-3-deoxyphosphogluconate aldolase/(4S)-4-hydroxy-2-oxoglutarate aldolase
MTGSGSTRDSANRASTTSRLTSGGVVAIMRHTEASLAIEAARALLAGGVSVVEVTLNTAGAIGMIRALAEALGDSMLVGAGTVLSAHAVNEAVDAGAQFIVAPNTSIDVIQSAAQRDVPCVPGAFTPTEILMAWDSGADLVKLFPASAGGPRYLRDVRGPLNHVPIVPTGGVNPENVGDFIRAGAIAVGAGSDLVDRGVVGRRDWTELERRARAFSDAVRTARFQ